MRKVLRALRSGRVSTAELPRRDDGTLDGSRKSGETRVTHQEAQVADSPKRRSRRSRHTFASLDIFGASVIDIKMLKIVAQALGSEVTEEDIRGISVGIGEDGSDATGHKEFLKVMTCKVLDENQGGVLPCRRMCCHACPAK